MRNERFVARVCITVQLFSSSLGLHIPQVDAVSSYQGLHIPLPLLAHLLLWRTGFHPVQGIASPKKHGLALD